MAYLEERTALKVYNLENNTTREILSGDQNYSYSDNDQHYSWSPDGKWFLVQYLPPKLWIPESGLVSADGKGEVINLTESGYYDGSPEWMMDGKMMIWFSDRDGMKNDASWGGEADVYALFFTQDGYDQYTMGKEEYDLMKSEEGKETDKSEEKNKDKEKEIQPLEINLNDIENRKVRLTIHSSRLENAIVSKDGEKLFYLTRFEKGYDLWQTDLKSKDTKVLTKLGAEEVGEMILDKEGKHLFILADGKIHKVAIGEGNKNTIGIQGEMVLRESEERDYLFEHIWRQVDKKFYKIDLHDLDWEAYKEAYQPILSHINNNHDFKELLSEMLGELNASHTGARYRPQNANGDKTAALGLFFDNSYTGNGLLIEEVMDRSPVIKKGSKIKANVVIEKIDGQTIESNTNLYQLLNRKAKKNTLLSLYDPSSGDRWEEVVKPINLNEENQLAYKRWVERCRKLVDEASGGEIGYVHVRSMNDHSYRTVFEEVLGKNANKKAIVVDTRFNGGGWLHDDLATFLNGKDYIKFMPRGQDLGSEPQFKWSKPSIVVMGESNYSDAHMFPFAYKELGIGKLVGMPVPGTGTAVWWERLQNNMVFGIPQVGMVGNDGQYLENTQLEPDIKVMNDYHLVTKGKDPQLEAAVKELQKQLKEIKP